MIFNFFILMIYLLTGIGAASVTLNRIFVKGEYNLYRISILYFVLIYSLVPAYVFGTGGGISQPFQGLDLSDRVDLYVISIPLILSSFIALIVGYKFKLPFRIQVRLNIKNKIFFVISLTVFGAICWLYFIYSYGGIEYVATNISKIRTGVDENKNYLGAFVKMFSSYITFASFFSFSYYISTEKYKKYFLVIFIFTFVISIIKLFFDGGRGGIISYFIGMLFIYILIKKKLPIFLTTVILLLMSFVGFFGKIVLFQIFSAGDSKELYSDTVYSIAFFDNFVKEYSHQFLSTFVALENGNFVPLRLGMDFIVWVLKPLKLFGWNVPDSISYYNTYLIAGEWSSDIPPGIIGLGVYNFGIFFCWVPSLLYGMMISVVEKPLKRLDYVKHPDILAIYGILFGYLPFALLNADPALFIQWMLPAIVFFGLLLLTLKLRVKLFSV